MIYLEIKETKDFDLVGTWNFNKNTITIGGGQSQLSDIKINNEDFKKEAAKIKIHQNILLVEVLDESILILLNGKKTIGRAFFKKENQLQIGHTLFVIKDFHYSHYDFSTEIEENLKKIIRGNHPINNIIKKLEQYLRE